MRDPSKSQLCDMVVEAWSNLNIICCSQLKESSPVYVQLFSFGPKKRKNVKLNYRTGLNKSRTSIRLGKF